MLNENNSWFNFVNYVDNSVFFFLKLEQCFFWCLDFFTLFRYSSFIFAVCLQPYEFDPTEKNKHKFMVQTVIAPEGDDHDNLNDVVCDVETIVNRPDTGFRIFIV